MISFDDLKGTPIMPMRSNLYMLAGESGNSIISFKSLLKAEYKSAGSVVWEPIEQNSFASYNKTTEPREYCFEVALQFPDNDFASALSTLEDLKKGTDKFTFVTPFTSFENLSLEGYSTMFETFTSMMIISLGCKEVLEVQQGYTNVTVNDATPIGSGDAQNPDNATTSDTGITGGQSPTDGEKQQARESILHRTGGTIIRGSRRANAA
ncbi:MAG: hypothetical protein J5915_10190 [Acidaminococcaceae bacterium]|nr:hypothetical protein [Acidaminococcaceae bacterium]